MLTNYKFKTLYNSCSDDIIENFYIPALSECNQYDRISAYFDSKVLKMYSAGLEYILNKQGHIRFVFSSDIDESDYELMKKGYDIRRKLEKKLMDSLYEEDMNKDIANLAYLIANGTVDIKIAFTKKGIFHDKFGLFLDADGNKLYFRGSNNETTAAILNNYESFETSVSWNCDANEMYKINEAIQCFENIWNNNVDGLIVIDLPEVVKNKLLSFKTDYIEKNKIDYNNSIIFDLNDDGFLIENNLDDKELILPGSLLFKFFLKPYVTNISNNFLYSKDMKVTTLNTIFQNLNNKKQQFGFNVCMTKRLDKYLFDRDLKIEKRKNLGIAIKHKDKIVINDFDNFKQIVDNNLERKLREPQMWDAYHIAKMHKSANFSVPGAGKTSIVYGAFAYLSNIGVVNKIVMIGPKNSFLSWKDEFKANFGNKKELNLLDIQAKNEFDKYNTLKYKSNVSNLILINYESVPTLYDVIKNYVVDDKTLLVFDEVHRIKSINGKRAKVCLNIAKDTLYCVALTGTPIPNGYVDLYNILHLLYENEYNDFFGFQENYLKSANTYSSYANIINSKIFPFFCRTTKNDLEVPPPCQDDITSGYIEMNDEEKRIIRIVYDTYHSNFLLLYIRLLQASSNPLLLLKSIDENDFIDDDLSDSDDCRDSNLKNALSDDKKIEISPENKEYISKHYVTRKIDKCCELIKQRVDNNEKVVVWGIFVDNLDLVSKKLGIMNISNVVIDGKIPLDVREQYIKQFCSGAIDVLIANPHTLAESVSLHKVCHCAIYFEYDFNLTHMVQSRDRIHRLGLRPNQKTEYIYMILNSKNTIANAIDFKIYRRLKEKEQVMIEAVEGNDIVCVDDNYENDIRDILNE